MPKKILISVFLIIFPMFAVEIGLGIVGNAGLGFSRWKMDIIDASGTFLTDHLQSNEPVFNVGPSANMWFTDNLGIRASVQYGFYNYNFTYDYTSSSHTIEWKWNYKNLIIPIMLTFGIPTGRNRIVIGAGFSICRQMSGQTSGIMWGQDLPVDNLLEDVLETTVAPEFLIGAEFSNNQIKICTSINYLYGLDGVGEQLATEITNHLFAVNLGVFYYLLSK